MASDITITDGSMDFSGGVNSVKVTTVQTERNPNGLSRSEVAWAVNAVFRDGGIYPRAGWQPVGRIAPGTRKYQGGFMYNPGEDQDPYLMISLSGQIVKINIAPGFSVQELSTSNANSNNPTRDISFLEQAEQFLLIQSGDGVTLPLIWDGVTLRRSLGLAGQATVPAGSTSGTFNVAIRNDTARPGVTVPANVKSAEVGGPFTAQIGPTLGPFIVPAIGATQVVQLKSDATAALGGVIGFSGSNANPFVTGQWTVTAVNVNGGGNQAAPGVTPEIPAAGPMDYYMGRIWYAQNRLYSAGDIVEGPSGTLAYGFNDSVLKVTENPLVVGGDGFIVPEGNDDIRALEHNAVVDAALGQGRLFIFTRKAIYSMVVPVTRTDWINADGDNQPLQAVVQLANGSVGHRCVVPINGDLYFQSLEPGIRSITSAVRYFQQPGNTQISSPMRRVLQHNNRALMRHSGGIYFNNRQLQAVLPEQTAQGVVHKALIGMDLTPISTLTPENQRPIWEGVDEGLNFLELFIGSFGGVERAFAVVVSSVDGSFNLWELTQDRKTENGDNRITWAVEFPAFTWNREMDLKRLLSGEIWLDRIHGTVDINIEYRPDSENCWLPWTEFQLCSPANTCEDPVNAVCTYPTDHGPSYRANKSFPKPKAVCEDQQGRPSDIAYQFQVKATVKGFCRIRALILHATIFERKLYQNMVC